MRRGPVLVALVLVLGPAARAQKPPDGAADAVPGPIVGVAPAPPVPPPPAEIAALTGHVKIYAGPRMDTQLVGLFRAGQVLRLRSGQPEAGPTVGPCAGGWYAVEPRGYVCASGLTSFDRSATRAMAARAMLPSASHALPLRYGLSKGAPRYRRVPTHAEQQRTEWHLDEHLAALPPVEGPAPSGPLARYLDQQAVEAQRAGAFGASTTLAGAYAPAGSKIAWADEVVVDGRAWVVTPDLELLPRDKVEPAPVVAPASFAPMPPLPFAVALWGAPRFVEESSRKHQVGELAPRHLLSLLGPPRPGAHFTALADGAFAQTSDLSVFVAADPPPGVGPDDKWLHVSVSQGTLVAYVGDRPLFAALVSPGIAGGAPGAEHRTVPGRYRIAQKWLTSDMMGRVDEGAWRSREVPFVAYYDGSYAVHGAWWHDRFGRPRSHGCINLSPADARFVFDWLEPALPADWYAVSTDRVRPGTQLVVAL